MKITRVSSLTGKENSMDLPVTQDQIAAWIGGTPIQDAMPELTPSQREFLMTGYTQEDWDKMFPPDEEEEL